LKLILLELFFSNHIRQRIKMSAIPNLLNIAKGEFVNIVIPDVPNHLISKPESNPFGMTCRELAELLEDRMKLGHISWIDFDNKTGVRRARVRFAHWYDNQTARNVRANIIETGSHTCDGYVDGQDYIRCLTGGVKITLLPE
jgi:hypothetical protein